MQRKDALIVDPITKAQVVMKVAGMLSKTLGINKPVFDLYYRTERMVSHSPKKEFSEEVHITLHVDIDKRRGTKDTTEIQNTLAKIPPLLSRSPSDLWELSTYYVLAPNEVSEHVNFTATSHHHLYTIPGWVDGATHRIDIVSELLVSLTMPRKALFKEAPLGSTWSKKYRRAVIEEYYENVLQLARREKLLGILFPEELTHWRDFVVPKKYANED